MRLIDAEALKEHVRKYMSVFAKYDWREICEMLNDAPTVDPIKHGHWIEHDFGLICSECNHYTETMYDEPFNNEFGKGWALKRPYYCGYCGAKMDEVADDES